MSRVQLALNVADLESSIDFYRNLFATEPHKRRPGYANFEITEPPLKLVLMEIPASQRRSGTEHALNHLGVEVSSTSEVAEHSDRLAAAGLAPEVQEQTNCCHAVQDKAWVHDPAGVSWEVYTITDDEPGLNTLPMADNCCTPAATAQPASAGASGCC